MLHRSLIGRGWIGLCNSTLFHVPARGTSEGAAGRGSRGWVPVPHVGKHGSSGIGATSVGSLVDTLVEAMIRASDF